MTDPLERYKAKRDFAKTPEPSGRRDRSAGHRFVVQKHDATRLHWDFRLELDGVLKSWAVTRGPSLDPQDKRLAVRTEDHPLEYATFEGTIPDGEYGGGTVMLWDKGSWASVAGKEPSKTLAEGHLHVVLHGERMKGEWLLVRMKGKPGDRNENWLLRKVEDEYAGASGDLVEQALTSVTTGRTMAEIASGKRATRPKGDARLPPFRDVQLATLVDHVPSGPGWLHEMKYDGYRLLIATGDGKARAYTRTGQDWSDRFVPIVDAFAALDAGSVLIDGEAVALDAEGKPDFRLLQQGLKEGGMTLAYFAFDLLEHDGDDLTPLPNVERKARLERLLAGASAPIHFAEHVANGEKLFEALCAAGLEGVVSKRASAAYSGRRTQSWLKTKCICRQEFIIIGWTKSDRTRGFRSLLLGIHRDGVLHYAGKAGTGFSGAMMQRLLEKMVPLERDTPAVADAPRAAVRGARWIEPQLVAEIAYSEVTAPLGQGGVLRHPSFIALREDKPAQDVKSEVAVNADPLGVVISNADRVIFPEANVTKGALAGYYAAMADPILRFAARRPVSIVRCPQGRARQCFFQKHDAGTFGDHVRHVPIEEKDGDVADYLYVEDGAGLLACVQMGAIEFHGWGALVDDVEHPDRMVFDLDPDPGVSFGKIIKAAHVVKDELAAMGLASHPMLSGGKGIHVVVALDRSADWPAVKDFARRFAVALAAAHPEMFTANIKKVERKGRIFLDWLRNQRGATAVLPWTVRARDGAPVAVPVGWDELDGIDRANAFTIRDLDALIEKARQPQSRHWCAKAKRLPAY